MRRELEWWQGKEVRGEVERALSYINIAQYSPNEDEVAWCSYLFNALNTLWTAHRRAANARGASDSQAIKDVLTVGIPQTRQQWFHESPSVDQVATFEPRILNHRTLNESAQYKPNRPIPTALAHKASKEHRQLAEAVAKWKSEPSEENQVALLVKLATMLYRVRSNIAHGEKTRFGPDLDKAERDRQVCAITRPVLNDLFEALFNFPANRLAVYGTLAPGEVNYHVIANIPGRWQQGWVRGVLRRIGPYPAFQWKLPGKQIPVKVFYSSQLNQHWVGLDRFEGSSYRRILCPIEPAGGRVLVANIYEAKLSI